jgi:hypothetical protein
MPESDGLCEGVGIGIGDTHLHVNGWDGWVSEVIEEERSEGTGWRNGFLLLSNMGSKKKAVRTGGQIQVSRTRDQGAVAKGVCVYCCYHNPAYLPISIFLLGVLA